MSDAYFWVCRHTFAIGDAVPQEENVTADSQKRAKKMVSSENLFLHEAFESAAFSTSRRVKQKEKTISRSSGVTFDSFLSLISERWKKQKQNKRNTFDQRVNLELASRSRSFRLFHLHAVTQSL